MLNASKGIVRLIGSLTQASARPHNERPSNLALRAYDANGALVTRNALVLKKEEEIEKYVLNVFKNYFRTCNKGELSATSDLIDHGLDRLDAIEIVIRLEDELGYTIPAESLLCFSNVKHFINYIKQTEDFKLEFNKEPIN
jgi:acyl carrier protein